MQQVMAMLPAAPRQHVTSLIPIERIASATLWPCELKTSTCRSFATISSALYCFLGIEVLLRAKTIAQAGPLQGGRVSADNININLDIFHP